MSESQSIQKELTPGLEGELRVTVTSELTAERWGSGLVPVYSTPALVGLMEGAAVQALEGALALGQTTVGTSIEVKHLAATPVGHMVRAMARLLEVDGRRLVFTIEAWDETEKIGEARHERFIVFRDKFLGRVQSKVRA